MYELGIIHASRTTKCLRNQGRIKGEGWATAKELKPTNNLFAGGPKAALLFWYFGGFRCGVLLSLLLLLDIKTKNRCLILGFQVTTCMGNGCSPG